MKRFLTLCFYLLLLLCSDVTYAQQAANQPTNPPSVVGPNQSEKETQTKPQQTEDERADENHRSLPENLSIDERMAEIAKEANQWAFFQTIIGFLGLFFVVAATIFAGLAWLAAKKGADIGQATLDETIIANKRAQRAYVGIGTYNYHFLPMDDGRVSFTVVCSISNFGQTPAFDQKNSTRIEIVDLSRGEDVETAPMESEGITLFPNTKPNLSVNLIISAENASAIRAETKKVFVKTQIAYVDIFGDTHWSKTQYTLRVAGFRSKFSTDHGGALTYYSEENSQQNVNV